jgi:hypothetical protein
MDVIHACLGAFSYCFDSPHNACRHADYRPHISCICTSVPFLDPPPLMVSTTHVMRLSSIHISYTYTFIQFSDSSQRWLIASSIMLPFRAMDEYIVILSSIWTVQIDLLYPS